MSTVVFVHAHPDDEAIFSGGTMLALAEAGHRVVLVVATGGELGLSPHEDTPLADQRLRELDAAAAILRVDALHLLGYTDSGMRGDPANHAPGSFWSTPDAEAIAQLGDVFAAESADAVVVYDDHGIYGHPDHVKGFNVGVSAAAAAGVDCVYEMTVDREYLHFVETHLVEAAALSGDLGLAGSRIGSASVEIDLTVDVQRHLAAKRAAMAAHMSQLPEHAPVFGLDDAGFADVYGWEWYLRRGTRGPLDELV